MSSDRAVGLGLTILVFLGFLIFFGCSGGGQEYYHVPSVSVDVDKHKGVKPVPKVNPAPKAPSFRKR